MAVSTCLVAVASCGSTYGVRVVGPEIEPACLPVPVGRPVTESVGVNGGKTPYTFEWVLDGKVVPPSTLDVRSAPFGNGVKLTFTTVPTSVNEELVLNVDGGYAPYGSPSYYIGGSSVVLGDGGHCTIGVPFGLPAYPRGGYTTCSQAGPQATVGRPVTGTVVETGGAVPYKFEWVLDGKVEPPAALNVQTTPYRNAAGTGLKLTFTVVPVSVNDILVLDANGDNPDLDGWAYDVLGEDSGVCLITAPTNR
jgi:hypothetical protein